MEDQGAALLFAVSRRHLPEAREICDATGEVALPVLEEGDLRSATPGMRVLILAAASGDEEERSVAWCGSMLRWSPDPPNSGIPSSIELTRSASASAAATADPGDRDEEGDAAESTVREPVWVVIEGLRELAVRERLHTNELISKRERGARFFVPRGPRIVRVPD